MNGMGKFVLAYVSGHPLRFINLGREKQINDQNVRFVMYEVFLLAGFYKPSGRFSPKHFMHNILIASCVLD